MFILYFLKYSRGFKKIVEREDSAIRLPVFNSQINSLRSLINVLEYTRILVLKVTQRTVDNKSEKLGMFDIWQEEVISEESARFLCLW